jgi:competence protein ComEC
MAVVVETPQRVLVYDTGPTQGPGADAGGRVVAPYLRSRGYASVDAVVVSHLDDDHSGGAVSLLQAVPHGWLASSLPPAHPIVLVANVHTPCRRGEGWQWGEATFEWLHPPPSPETGHRSATNALSCVLRISSPAGVVLLTGDIESAQERRLLEVHPGDRLRSDVLLVPHHGSATSSSPAFIDAVAPAWAIFQVGYRSRFRHPNPKVLERYVQRGIGILRSDHDGALQIRLAAGQPAALHRARQDPARYWRIDAAGEGRPQRE